MTDAKIIPLDPPDQPATDRVLRDALGLYDQLAVIGYADGELFFDHSDLSPEQLVWMLLATLDLVRGQ